MTDNLAKQVTALLRTNNMTADTLDLQTLTNLFLAQMRISLYGGNSSIPMLPTFLRPFGTLLSDQTVAVAQLDDQQVKVCLVTFQNGTPVVTDEGAFPIPGREYPAPLSDLIYAAAELLEPLAGKASAIVLCVSYPVDYDGKGDGVIRRFPGNMTVTDFANTPLLAQLAQEFTHRGLGERRLLLVSEADAVLLAAGVLSPGQPRYLGLTWGSGIDVGFAAPGSIVLRWLGIRRDLMLFDGGFSSAQCVPFSLVDYSRDRDSYGPGLDLYWKMVSTDYLGDTFRFLMIQAAEQKLLSFGCSRDILSLTKLDTSQVVEFLSAPEGSGFLSHYCREPADREVALAVAEGVLDRAARLICANVAAVLSLIGAGREKDAPACIGLAGEAFAQPILAARLQSHLTHTLSETLGFHVTLCNGEHMVAIGSAAAAMYHGQCGETPS